MRCAGLSYREYQSPEQIIGVRQMMEAFGWDWAWLHLDDAEFERAGWGGGGREERGALPPTTWASTRDAQVAEGP